MATRLLLRIGASALLTAALAAPQAPRLQLKDLDLKEISLGEDEPGCSDSALVPRLGGCNVIQCGTREYDSLEMQVAATPDGVPQKEVADGASEVLYYLCPGKLSPSHIVKQTASALTKAGFKAVFEGKDGEEFPTATLQKDDHWVQVSTYTYNTYSAYVLAAVKLAPEPPVTAEGMADELKARGNFLLTGINFEGEAVDLPADSDKVLGELEKALKSDLELKIRLEVHTDNLEGPKTSQEITDKRAATLINWLAGHGIDKSRVTSQGFGSAKPLADNESEDGRARNRRIHVFRADAGATAPAAQ